MLKRTNKITSLLIAAAAVISLVPANAADVKKFDVEEGTIYHAEVDTNGAYIDGEINGAEEAVYYESNGKFTALLDDIDLGQGQAYSSGQSGYMSKKSHIILNGGDYSLDLSDGTVAKGNYWEDYVDAAAEALWKNIKKDTDSRYDKTETKDMTSYDDGNISNMGGAGDWYQTTYTNVDSDCVNIAEMPTLTVYSDQDGNYIDADYNLGKIKVTTTDSADKVHDTVIDNTNDDFDVDDADDSTISAYVTNQIELDMDGDYIYRSATVTINTTAEGITKINGKSVDGTAFNKISANSVSFNVIQKISKKASSDTINGVPYADSVTNYIISDENGDNDSSEYDMITSGDSNTRVSYGGRVREFYTDADKTSDNVVVRTYILKGSNGFYYLDATDTNTVTEDAEIDGDGNVALVTNGADLYRLDNGNIYKYDDSDDGDWDKLYQVDGSFDDFKVNSDTNMIAWSQDDEVYSIINETPATDDVQTTTTAAVTVGWSKASNGIWTYVKDDGTKATGWFKDGSIWYYLNDDGVMVTGWINDNDSWYYCNESGAMLSNTIVDGYELGSNGAWIK